MPTVIREPAKTPEPPKQPEPMNPAAQQPQLAQQNSAPQQNLLAQQPQVVEHRRTVTIQATHYMMQEMKRTNELLELISRKILARDQSGKAYNVEVQRVLSGASVQRARFNSAMVDVMLLKKGEAHQQMPDLYTIFITEDDMFGKGIPAYHACNKIDELDNMPLNDGGYIVYVKTGSIGI